MTLKFVNYYSKTIIQSLASPKTTNCKNCINVFKNNIKKYNTCPTLQHTAMFCNSCVLDSVDDHCYQQIASKLTTTANLK